MLIYVEVVKARLHLRVLLHRIDLFEIYLGMRQILIIRIKLHIK